MKATKRIAGALLAILIMALSVSPALAAANSGSVYTPIKLTTTTTGFGLTETLKVENIGSQHPAVTYTLTLGEPVAYVNGSITYGAVDNAAFIDDPQTLVDQILGTVSFNAAEVPGGTSATKPYTIPEAIIAKINAIEFKEPGIYYWPITKTKDYPGNDLSNFNRSSDSPNGTALLVRVDHDQNTHKLVPTVGIAVLNANGTPSNNKDTEYKDLYPTTPGKLTLTKDVTGNQGSRDQYFKYTVKFSGLDQFNGAKIIVDASGTTVNKPGTTLLYGEVVLGNHNSATELDIENGKAEGIFWLRDGETVSFDNIPFGSGDTKYEITEFAHDTYDVTYTILEGTTPLENANGASGDTTGERVLSKDKATSVTFKNDKAITTPTGVDLQTVAPLFGILLAGALLVVMKLGKRKGDNA